jgi:predicted DNA-binding transcriptional regulator AlpA
MRVPHDQGSPEDAGVGTNERNKRVELISTTATRPVVHSGGGGDAGNNGGDAGDGNDGDNDRGYRGRRQRAKLSVTTSPHQRFGDRSVGDGNGDRCGRRLLQTRDLLRRYSIVDRTLDRWLADPRLNFPKPMIVNRRRYWSESEIDAFDAQQKLATARALRAKAEAKMDAAQKADASA